MTTENFKFTDLIGNACSKLVRIGKVPNSHVNCVAFIEAVAFGS